MCLRWSAQLQQADGRELVCPRRAGTEVVEPQLSRLGDRVAGGHGLSARAGGGHRIGPTGHRPHVLAAGGGRNFLRERGRGPVNPVIGPLRRSACCVIDGLPAPGRAPQSHGGEQFFVGRVGRLLVGPARGRRIPPAAVGVRNGPFPPAPASPGIRLTLGRALRAGPSRELRLRRCVRVGFGIELEFAGRHPEAVDQFDGQPRYIPHGRTGDQQDPEQADQQQHQHAGHGRQAGAERSAPPADHTTGPGTLGDRVVDGTDLIEMQDLEAAGDGQREEDAAQHPAAAVLRIRGMSHEHHGGQHQQHREQQAGRTDQETHGSVDCFADRPGSGKPAADDTDRRQGDQAQRYPVPAVSRVDLSRRRRTAAHCSHQMPHPSGQQPPHRSDAVAQADHCPSGQPVTPTRRRTGRCGPTAWSCRARAGLLRRAGPGRPGGTRARPSGLCCRGLRPRRRLVPSGSRSARRPGSRALRPGGRPGGRRGRARRGRLTLGGHCPTLS